MNAYPCKTPGCKRFSRNIHWDHCPECESARIDDQRATENQDAKLKEKFRPAEQNTPKMFEDKPQ